MPLITVITAVKNAAAFLPETIESIQAQSVTDWRYVIVDDASDDETPALAEKAAATDNRIGVVRLDESIGPYAAANLAARDVDSKYIARIDGDDLAHRERFALQLEALSARPDATACAGGWRELHGGATGPVRMVPTDRNGVIKWMMWFRSNLLHSTLLIDTECFHELGGYGPERIAEDFRLWAALVRRNQLTTVDRLLVDYRVSSGQITAEAGYSDKPERVRIALDHMLHCDPGGAWSEADARDIRWIGQASTFPPSHALELVERFERAWRADASLTDGERSALTTMTAARRIRHLRQNLRQQPPAVALSVMRHPRIVVQAGLRAARDRENQWP